MPTFELVFVLTQEKAFSYRFYFKSIRKSIGFSKKRTRGFQNGFLFERSACFCVTVTGYFELF